MFTATSALRWQLLRAAPDGLEDGTLPFYEIMALSQGLDVRGTLDPCIVRETNNTYLAWLPVYSV